MGATDNLTKSDSHPKNNSKSPENQNPSGSIITALVLVAVLAGIGGIVYHFFKNRSKKEITEDASS